MPKTSRTLFLLADGVHARFVRRSPETSHFVTLERMDDEAGLETLREEQRDEASGRSYESAGSARHGVGREDVYRDAKAKFAVRAAKALGEKVAKGDWDAVVLVAPARILPVLRNALAPDVKVVGEVSKDLIKTPDHELGAWLDHPDLGG